MTEADTTPKHTGWTKWFPVLRKHKHVCCDCSLQHSVEQRIDEDGTVWERWKRDNRATAALRRKR